MEIISDPVESARVAGLEYVSDDEPGIRRLRAGKGFRYIGPDGQPIRDEADLQRIKSLAIPPAWTEVWICPAPDGHIQATARDTKGRKVYRYHPRWREVRDETKFNRMIQFALALPQIRARVDEDLSRPGLPREKVLAAVVRLLELTHIRVGNEEYAVQNESFGLTTLRDDHVQVEKSRIVFEFRGKSGKDHAIDLRDQRLARIVKRSQDLPGERLFQYLDDTGAPQWISSGDVNGYLRAITGQEFSAKDFRTWAASVLCAQALTDVGPTEKKTVAKRQVNQAIDQTAARLGNTRAVCRKSYIHPAILEAYLEGRLFETREVAEVGGLTLEERAVLAFLQGLEKEVT